MGHLVEFLMNNPFLLTTAIILGFFIWFSISKSKQNNEVGLSFTFGGLGTSLIVGAFGGTPWDKTLNYIISIEQQEGTDYVQLLTGIALVILSVVLNRSAKSKENILNLLGVKERKIADYQEELKLKDLHYTEREIHLQRYATAGVEMTKDRFEDATVHIRSQVESYCSDSKYSKRGYTGTAAIPLTMFAGYCFKGPDINNFYEYNRKTDSYEVIKKEKIKNNFIRNFISKIKKSNSQNQEFQNDLQIVKELSDMPNDISEVVIGVSVTEEIKEDQLSQFGAPFLHLKVNEPKANYIRNMQQLNCYVDTIFKTLVEASKINSIKKIHLIISSQSCLPFKLGTKLTTNTYMKEIISYHFVASKEPCYPWGIAFGANGIRLILSNKETGPHSNSTPLRSILYSLSDLLAAKFEKKDSI